MKYIFLAMVALMSLFAAKDVRADVITTYDFSGAGIGPLDTPYTASGYFTLDFTTGTLTDDFFFLLSPTDQPSPLTPYVIQPGGVVPTIDTSNSGIVGLRFVINGIGELRLQFDSTLSNFDGTTFDAAGSGFGGPSVGGPLVSFTSGSATAMAPEPSTWMLLGTGLLVLVCASRKFRLA